MSKQGHLRVVKRDRAFRVWLKRAWILKNCPVSIGPHVINFKNGCTISTFRVKFVCAYAIGIAQRCSQTFIFEDIKS